MKKPNLFLIGAMKSGTTTLHELLAQHPQVVMSEPKEPCYFVEPELLRSHWPEMWRRGYWKDEAAYLALFPERPGALYYGESSTDYTKSPRLPGVAERLSAFSPDARILYVMRDPIERTLSHYWHMVELRGEKRPPMEAIQGEPHYTEVSHYAYQLQPYIEHFGLARIRLLTFEALKADPGGTLREVCDWLGVATEFQPSDLHLASNVTPPIVQQKRPGLGALDAFRRSALWDSVGRFVPPSVRKVGVRMVEKSVAPKSVDTSDVKRHLRALQRPQVEALTRLAGRSFPEWKTLYAE